MMDQEHATHQHNGPGMHVEDSGTSTEVSFGVAIVSESHQLLWSNLLKIANLFRLMHVIVLLHSGQVYSYLGECSLMILGLVTCVWHAACGQLEHVVRW